MSVYRFKKTAGNPDLEGIDDPSMTLQGEVVPEWIRLPDSLGGTRCPVLGQSKVNCPCGGNHIATEYSLGDSLFVAECPTARSFLWYKR